VSEPARYVDPVAQTAAKALLRAYERLEVVGLHERSRRMGDVKEADIAEVHGIRSADQANGIDRDLGAVDRDRLDHPHMNIEPHDRHVGIDQRVVQARREDLPRALGADLLRQHSLVLVEGRARALAVVQRGVRGPAVAVADDVALAFLPGCGGPLLLGLDDGRALLVALTARELYALLVDGRGTAERHVIGIEHVFDLELPVARIGVTVHAGVEREFARGGTVDEIVDVALYRADVVFEARTLRHQAREHEATIFAD